MKRALVIGLAMFLILINIANSIVPSSTFPKETKFFDRLAANDEQFVIIDSPDILFTKVGITTNRDITRARVTVQAMPDCPENAPYQTDVLQCYVVTPSSFKDVDIVSTEINFKVPKEWINANNYDKNGVELRRYSYSWNIGGKLSSWKTLNTVFDSEDDAYYYYKSSTDGFSYFSIVGGKKIEGNVVSDELISPMTEAPVEEKPAQIVMPAADAEKRANPIFTFVALLSLISIVISFALHRRHINVEGKEEIAELAPAVDYINSVSGYPEADIRQALVDSGWKDWEIDMAFGQVKLKP